MLGRIFFIIAAFFVANASSQILFAECPNAYTHYCFHGTCRFLISEWTASCKCFKGYIGNRCQKMDLLQVVGGDLRSFSVGTIVIVLILITTTCLVIYLCRRTAQSKLTLLKNIDLQALAQRKKNGHKIYV